MQGIDPKWVFYLGVIVTIEQGIAGGSIKLAHAIPDSWIPVVDAWASILAFAGTAVMTGLSAYSSKTAGPLMQPPSPAVKVLAWLIMPLALVLLMGGPAGAQAPRPRPPLTGNLPADAQNLKDKLSGQSQGSNDAAQGGVASQGGDRLAQILAKPFNDLADFINTDAAEAATLATAIPGLQDGHGQQCWMAMGQFTAVIKAHPIPVTLHAATDLEAFRLANMAANNLCSNVHCTQVFSDLSNAVQQVAGQVGGVLVTGGLQIPSLNSLCSKVPQVIVAAPISAPATPAQP
jgi:hypothetical protein